MSCRVVSRPSDQSKIREEPQALMVTSLEIRRFHPTGRSKNGKRNRATRRVVYWHWVCEEKGTSLRERRWVSRVSCQRIELLEVLVICLRSTYVSPPATLSTVSKNCARPDPAGVESAGRNCHLGSISCRGTCTGTSR